MKKKLKLVLGCLLSTMLLGSCSSNDNFSGAMIEEIHEEGPGEYDWKQYDVDIAYNAYKNPNRYYSNHKKDCIYDISFRSEKAQDEYGNLGVDYYVIEYEQDFSWADDLEVIFVVKNNFPTKVETEDGRGTKDVYKTYSLRGYSDWDISSEEIEISYEDGVAMHLSNSRIVEIWIRTID